MNSFLEDKYVIAIVADRRGDVKVVPTSMMDTNGNELPAIIPKEWRP
jgi:hypothetical protein